MPNWSYKNTRRINVKGHGHYLRTARSGGTDLFAGKTSQQWRHIYREKERLRVQCSVCWRHWNGHEQRRRCLLLMLLNQFLFGEAQSDPLHLQLDNASKNPIATRVCVRCQCVCVCERVCVFWCVLLCTLTDWQSFLAWHSVLKCWRKCWKLAKELRLFASIVAAVFPVILVVVVIYLTENMKVI